MAWTKPSYVEITGAEARAIRDDLRRQAFKARECWACLAPLRDRTSTYCSTACREEMGDPGEVDLPPLVIQLRPLLMFATIPDDAARYVHAAA